jgi:hypothetical protein
MPHHQQLRTLANFSSKPYIETRDQKKEKTEFLQTRDTYVKRKRGESSNKAHPTTDDEIFTSTFTSQNLQELSTKTPQICKFPAPQMQKELTKKNLLGELQATYIGIEIQKSLRNSPPASNARARPLSLALRARIPVCTRPQKLDETLTTISNVRLKILSSQTHPQKAYLPGFFFLFIVFSFFVGIFV